MLELKYKPEELLFSEVFEVSSNARTSTQVIDVEIAFNGHIGYGQASFPPYMLEKREKNIEFLSMLKLHQFQSPFQLSEIYQHMDEISSSHRPAKAAIDMAIYDLMGKIANMPVRNMLGLETQKSLSTSFTIGIGKDEFILRQLEKSVDFTFLKIKLGADKNYNRHVIGLIRQHTSKPIGVDFNQGMADKEDAAEMIGWLNTQGVEYAEQPLPAPDVTGYIWLKEHSPIDIYGDESIQTIQDIIEKKDQFHGVNIKLMKCGGLSKAYEMVRLAQTLGMKTMLGCMVESVSAITAAAQIGCLFDRLDLDGHLNIKNDPYEGVHFEKGELKLSNHPGLGISKK
jgi:L-alanine-DL-glutamate epimerase-like enolase superfamily enzyme